MARIINKTGSHIDIYKLVNDTIQGNSNLGPNESQYTGGGKGYSVKYWIKGKTSTSKIVKTEDYNGVYDLY